MPWTLADAKNRFSAVVQAALTDGPQRVTRRGAPAVVVVAEADYTRLQASARGGLRFTDHLLAIPAAPDPAAGLAQDADRPQVRLRDVDLS